MKADAIGAWPAGRLPLAVLAVIATAYEDRMDGDAGRATWRTDQRYTQCSRDEAGAYLRFLAGAGYELSPVEQAVADGVPYAGDHADEELAGPDGRNAYGDPSVITENPQGAADDLPPGAATVDDGSPEPAEIL